MTECEHVRAALGSRKLRRNVQCCCCCCCCSLPGEPWTLEEAWKRTQKVKSKRMLNGLANIEADNLSALEEIHRTSRLTCHLVPLFVSHQVAFRLKSVGLDTWKPQFSSLMRNLIPRVDWVCLSICGSGCWEALKWLRNEWKFEQKIILTLAPSNTGGGACWSEAPPEQVGTVHALLPQFWSLEVHDFSI